MRPERRGVPRGKWEEEEKWRAGEAEAREDLQIIHFHFSGFSVIIRREHLFFLSGEDGFMFSPFHPEVDASERRGRVHAPHLVVRQLVSRKN